MTENSTSKKKNIRAGDFLENFAELREKLGFHTEPKREDEFTAREYAERFNLEVRSAKNELDRMEKQGLVISRTATVKIGKRRYWVRVFRPTLSNT